MNALLWLAVGKRRMPLDLVDFERKTAKAVKTFWANRELARLKQSESGKSDQGGRASVTAGNNMNAFTKMMVDVVRANGLADAEIHQERAVVTLPGFFRPTKLWDLVVTYKGELIAAVELKSHVGPSFGNNFNNRTEEAVGTAHDFWTAYRDGAFGKHPRPFAGWLMLVEDAPGSRSPVECKSPHFPVFAEFDGASYLERYDLLCQKLVKEQLYTSATVLTSPMVAAKTGKFANLSEMTDLKTFVASLAGHAAAAAARLG